jgi:hypothetical protein
MDATYELRPAVPSRSSLEALDDARAPGTDGAARRSAGQCFPRGDSSSKSGDRPSGFTASTDAANPIHRRTQLFAPREEPSLMSSVSVDAGRSLVWARVLLALA